MSTTRTGAPERWLTVSGVILLGVAAAVWLLDPRTPEAAQPPTTQPHQVQTPAPPGETATTSAATPTPTSAAGPTKATDAATPTDEPTRQDGDLDEHEHGEQVSGAPTPATTTQQKRWEQARGIAEEAAQAFARPSAAISESQWWRDAGTHFSARARADYAGTDPAGVPWSRVEGKGVMVPTDAPDQLLMIVEVPVDTGTVRVELTTTIEEEIQVAWIGLAADS